MITKLGSEVPHSDRNTKQGDEFLHAKKSHPKNGQVIPIDQQVLLGWIGTSDILAKVDKVVSHQHRLPGLEADFCRMWKEAVGCHPATETIHPIKS